MASGLKRTLLILAVVFIGGSALSMSTYGQNTDPFGRPVGRDGRRGDDDPPRSVKENLQKMRIEREKRDYQELLDKADEALKVSSDLEKLSETSNSLGTAQREKLDQLEKLVKKIRSEIGGKSDDDDGDADEPKPSMPSNFKEAVQAIRKNTIDLVKDIKGSSRFAISASAIKSSNLVLRLAGFLRNLKP